MKNYSRKRAHQHRLAYRTPERFIYRKYQEISKAKSGIIKRKKGKIKDI